MDRIACKVNEIPSWTSIILYGLQQALVCIPGLLLTPQIISECVCAGSASASLKSQLMAATFFAAGLATFFQSTLGLRLPIMHGPAAAFLPPLYAYRTRLHCTKGENDFVSEEEWLPRLKEIAGSLMFGCVFFITIGATGLAGYLARQIGPITIVPVMILLCMSIIPLMQDMMSTHWISILAIVIVVIMIIYLEDYPVYIPGCGQCCIFGQYPLALTVLICWALSYVLTFFGWEDENSPIRYDRNQTMAIMQTDWFALLYPGMIGMPRFNLGLGLAFIASVMVDIVENLGSYGLLARVCGQIRPPKDAVNRAIMVEGFGSLIGASMGVGMGLTTYSNNIAIIQITKIASRAPMQFAGIFIFSLGIFTKIAGALATIPDAIIGGLMIVVIGTIVGVSLSNLHIVDLSLSRNLSIMGFSLMAGLAIPLHFEKFPFKTGYEQLDDVINMLVSIKMLVGGIIAAFLDNTVGGATLIQRGLHHVELSNDPFTLLDDSGYAFPKWFTRITSRLPIVRNLPFVPTLNIHKHNKTSVTINRSSHPADSSL